MDPLVIARIVRNLKPGERVHVDERQLRFPSYEYNGAIFTAADQVLEKIVGAAYEFRYWLDHVNRCVVFERTITPVEYGQAYLSPDRKLARA